MLNLPVIAMVLVASSMTLLSVNSIDSSALHAGSNVDISRSVLCTTLLSLPDWEDMGFDDVDRSKIQPVSGLVPARSYVGDQGLLDDETASLMYEAQSHSRMRVEIQGEMEIRMAMDQANASPKLYSTHGDTHPPFIGNLQVFKDYQTGRFAVELERFNEILTNYAEGKHTNVTLMAVSQVSAPSRFLSFAIESATSAWITPASKRIYFWHILSYDPDTQQPVWRAGWSEL